MSSAAFRHGPLEVITRDTFALIFLGLGETIKLNLRLANDILSIKGQVLVVGTGTGELPFNLPVYPPAAQPILEILPAQILTLALAEVMGIKAGHFVYASKVTSTE